MKNVIFLAMLFVLPAASLAQDSLFVRVDGFEYRWLHPNSNYELTSGWGVEVTSFIVKIDGYDVVISYDSGKVIKFANLSGRVPKKVTDLQIFEDLCTQKIVIHVRDGFLKGRYHIYGTVPTD